MSRPILTPEQYAALKPFKRGLWYQHEAAREIARKASPTSRAGRIGGRVSARLYPASAKPRDGRGRFMAQPRTGHPGGQSPKLTKGDRSTRHPAGAAPSTA